MDKKSKKILLFPGLFLLVCFSLFFSVDSKYKKELVYFINSFRDPVYLTYSVNVFPEESHTTPPFSMPEIKQPLFPENICNIADFGAVGDGKTINTKAFSDTISECARRGGGKIIVPTGKWLTGAIKLKSNIQLEIQKDAEILFSPNFDDYLPVVLSRFEGVEYYNYSPPIYARDCTNIAITGEGKINGQGEINWWKMSGLHTIKRLYEMGNQNIPVKDRVFGKEEDGLRPSFIQFVNCKNILIDGPTFIRGPMWTVHPIYSSDIIIKNVHIQTSPGRSTDGIVLDSSKNILVENAVLDTGDDAIVLKSGRNKDGLRVNIPSENIVVRNSIINEAHGTIVIGSETSGGVRNVFAYNLSTNSADYGIRMKSTKGRGGIVENIWFQGLSMRSISDTAIQINLNYEKSQEQKNDDLPVFRNIHINDIICEKTRTAVFVDGLAELPLENLWLEDLNINSRDGMAISNLKNITLKNILIKPRFNPVYEFNNLINLSSDNLDCSKHPKECILISGDNSNNLILSGSGINQKNTTSLTKKDAFKIEVK